MFEQSSFSGQTFDKMISEQIGLNIFYVKHKKLDMVLVHCNDV